MQTHVITTYSFEELNDTDKLKAIDDNRDANTFYDWHDCTISDWKEQLKESGIEVSEINFSGFASQGDGAMFEGRIYSTDLENFLHNYPCNVDRRVIALIMSGEIDFYFSVKHRGHYYHSYCSEMDIRFNYTYNECVNYNNIDRECEKLEDHIRETYHDICNEIYKSLEREYDYLTSDEAIKETLISNNYEFYEDGTTY